MSFNSITANLLASENLTVVECKAETASFDVKNRVLYLPSLNPDFEGITDMFTCHEVGHAKYTTQEFNEVFSKSKKTLRTYYNICEDARIEKLIKREYPGLRKVMAQGYELFNSKGLFVPEGVDVNSLNLIDRVNVYFKGSAKANINFTLEERELVEEVARAETWQEVVTIGDKLYALAKEQAEAQEELRKQENQTYEKSDDDAEESDTEESDAEESDAEESEDDNELEEEVSGEDSEDESEDNESELESLTQDNLDRALKEATNNSIDVVNYTLETKFDVEMIKPYKEILNGFSDMNKKVWNNYSSSTLGGVLAQKGAEWDKFHSSTIRTVNYMYKEFEMKKCAHRLRHAQTSRSGFLNMNKIFQYQLRDDIFRNITITADDKNHGMLFLLDWSGSMLGTIHNTICQVLALTMFCRRAKIPHKVLAFSSGMSALKDAERTAAIVALKSKPDNQLISLAGYEVKLLEFITDEMNEREYTLASKLLFSGIIRQFYELNGTPLISALVYMHSFVNQYKRERNIEKLTFVVLTDGESHDGSITKGGDSRTPCRGDERTMVNLTDPVTKEIHRVMYGNYVNVLLKMIKSSSGANVIGFFLGNARDIPSALNCVYRGLANHITLYNMVEAIKHNWKKDGYAMIKPMGYDALYMVRNSSLDIKDYEPNFEGDKTAVQIAREMTKVNNTSINNKVLMGRIIGNFA